MLCLRWRQPACSWVAVDVVAVELPGDDTDDGEEDDAGGEGDEGKGIHGSAVCLTDFGRVSAREVTVTRVNHIDGISCGDSFGCCAQESAEEDVFVGCPGGVALLAGGAFDGDG